jgi:hypothetical protein
MTKYYTENNQMYFEVQEVESSQYSKDNKEYLINAFYKNDNNDYRYERQIPEDVFFNNKVDAEVVAESLSWVFNWGVDTTKENIKEQVIKELQQTLKNI